MSKRRSLRILMIRLGAMGDVVHALPSLQKLREFFPESELDWVVEEEWSPLLEGHPALSHLIVLPRKRWQKSWRRRPLSTLWQVWDFLKRYRRKKYDVVLDLHGNLRSGVMALLARSKAKFGFWRKASKEGNHRFLREVPVPLHVHKIEKNLYLLQRVFGLPFSPPSCATFPPFPPLGVEILRWWSSIPQPRIFLHPMVSRYGQIKQWPLPFFARLAELLSLKLNAGVILGYGPGEKKQLEELRSLIQVEVFPLPRLLSLPELVQLLARVDFFVGCDTGNLHIASALGVPALGLYGPKSVDIYGPYYPNAEALFSSSRPCLPCNLRLCPYGRNISPCMEELTPELVFAHIQRRLERQ
ncbi:MAG: lipopolysaccharide heptosyltransferase family protein [Planctomycetota bacterium]|nr:MAG: lipopolysaccharide heptosyltransferase family protein [Planctomycetota bacterium]